VKRLGRVFVISSVLAAVGYSVIECAFAIREALELIHPKAPQERTVTAIIVTPTKTTEESQCTPTSS
jgi:hypothetical protein